jgi:small GTP-binding protein
MAFAINVPNRAAAAPAPAGADIGNGMRMLRDTTGRYAVEHDLLLKGIIVGDSGVGKSSLLYRFSDGDWNPHYVATIGVDFKTLTFDKAGKIVRMQLWDTAGQDRFRTVTRTFYRGVHGCVLVFDVTDAESFEHVRDWVKECQQHGSPDTPYVLVGNKADLAAAGARQVPVEAAQALAQALGCEYVEASAKSDSNVAAAFAKLADVCVERKQRALAAGAGAGPMGLRNPNRRVQLAQPAPGADGDAGKSLCAGRCG